MPHTLSTLSTRLVDNKYIHSFKCGELVYVNICKNDLYNTSSTLECMSNKNCRIRLYTPNNCKLNWCKYNEHSCKTKILSNKISNVSFSNKIIVIVTDSDCVLYIKLIQNYSELIPRLYLSNYTNERHCMDMDVNNINLVYSNVYVTGLKYYLMTNTALTLSKAIDVNLRAPPYGIKIDPIRGCILNYSISMKPSSGDDSIITVKCIESESECRYSIINCKPNIHKGAYAKGCFNIPMGCFDVGLMISTPYGFSGNIGDDPKKDCIKFEEFKITY